MYRSYEIDPDRGEATQTPRILAVADVHLTAGVGVADEIVRFYSELTGLEPMADPAGTPAKIRFTPYFTPTQTLPEPTSDLPGTDMAPAGPLWQSPIVLRGYPRSGPWLYITLLSEPPAASNRRQLVVQVASLFECRQRLEEWAIASEWSRGWSYYERRLAVLDPAGNRIELVCSHPF